MGFGRSDTPESLLRLETSYINLFHTELICLVIPKVSPAEPLAKRTSANFRSMSSRSLRSAVRRTLRRWTFQRVGICSKSQKQARGGGVNPSLFSWACRCLPPEFTQRGVLPQARPTAPHIFNRFLGSIFVGYLTSFLLNHHWIRKDEGREKC